LKYFLDTSVLVAAVLFQHPQHDKSLAIYRSANRRTACTSAHSLLEVYATLTRLPGNQSVGSEQALLFIDDVRSRLTVTALEASEYWSLLESAVAENIVGGTIYDLLIAHSALRAGAETIYTWDVAAFKRLGPEIARRVRTP
jgi:predicted nucleic acid-binding protein